MQALTGLCQSDNCNTATVITLGPGNTCVTGTTINATSNNTTYGTCNTNPVNEVWYTFVTQGSQNDFNLTSLGITELEMVIDDDGCNNTTINSCYNATGTNPISASLGYVPGTQIWIMIASNQGTEGDFQFCINSYNPPPSGGNACSGAIPVCDKYQTYNTPDIGILTASGTYPSCFDFAVNQDIWYQFTVTQTGILEWEATPLGAGIELDWAIYDITSGCPGALVACNYNYTGGASGPAGMITGSTCPGGVACPLAGPFGTGNLAPDIPCGEYCAPITVFAGNTYVIMIDNYTNTLNTGLDFAFGSGMTALIEPVVNYSISPNTVTCGSSVTVTITDNSLGTPVWNFGNGNTFTGNNPPSQTYSSPGTYAITATITDPSGCTSLQTEYVNLYAPLAATQTQIDESCGSCNGEASVSVTGGDGIYNYSWNTGETTPLITGLCSGNYSVTISNTICGSSIIETFTINNSNSGSNFIDDTNISITDATCAGNDGSITGISLTGGTAPYTYTWTDGTNTVVGSSLDLNNVNNGNYTLVVSDVSGCADTIGPYSINLTGGVGLSLSQVDPICNGNCTGSITATPSGGVPPYAYNWSSGQTTSSITNLCAGSFTVTVSDAGCTASGIELVYNGGFGAGNTGFTSSYYYCNASNCLGPPGGYGIGYNSQFFNGGFLGYPTTACPSNCDFLVVNGSDVPNTNVWCQTISVTPNTLYEFSTWVSTLNISNPATLQFSINGVTIGAPFNAPATTGTWSQFFETWNSGTNTSAQICIVNQNTINAGNDFGLDDISFQECISACPAIQTVVMTEPSAITLSVNGSDANCFASNDGSATLTASGGSIPLNYLWNDPMAQTTLTASNLSAGTYDVTVTDKNNCTNTISVTIDQPTQLQTATSSVSSNCGQNDGNASVTASGGTGAYTYNWNTTPIQTTATANSLAAGTYYITITDSTGCFIDTNVTVSDVGAGSSSINTSTDASCYGSCDGQATASMGSGTSPFTYQWDDPGNQTNSAAVGLCQGTYNVTVTDSVGCTGNASITINEPAAITGSAVSMDATCNGGCDGSVNASISGGTPPFSYIWDDPSSQTDSTAIGLCQGTYNVTITDSLGCTAIASNTINEPNALSINITGNDTLCFGQSTQLYASSNGGNAPYTYSWSNSLPSDSVQTISPSTSTTYQVTATDSTGCTTQDSFAVYVQLPINVSVSDTNICEGQTATLSASVSAGNGGPYSYLWLNNGATTPSIDVSPTDTTNYLLEVSDGCSDTVTVSIQVIAHPMPISYFIAGCYPDSFVLKFYDSSSVSSGSINSWLWDFGDGNVSTSQQPSHNFDPPGTYPVSLTVISNFGCSNVYTQSIQSAPTADFSLTPSETTTANPIVSFTDSSSSDVTSWSWNFGDPYSSSNTDSIENPIHSFDSSGTYQIFLTVISSNGCVDTISRDVLVSNEYTLFAPNAFSPDENGVNDYFFPTGIGIGKDRFEMMIYDRWGDLIFHTIDIDKPWDGRSNKGSKIAPLGVYVWIINTTDESRKKHQYIGHVSLIR